ncbi:CRISPR-associated helicase Cas3' [Algoriphagus sp. C2-6-M1]|uniref:CRISPR-associated helicase Cas3' n=1 Tax=Algoriphagus persicinus TaxID=3108754 RepID=UPI002B3D4A1F|nr:CRISPR-associated helicase Cas3' [Algoriphagus sp. C2-6-M1]MEB2780551.1 CRISPR-associated helicase Cas3' [Algoriphagus sp. C2-6-M1]
MKSFKELIAEEQVGTLLKNPDHYLAHTPNETLGEHMGLVTHYFQDLIAVHSLEPLIDIMVLKLCKDAEGLATFAKKLFWQAILYHDFGKVNENFQRKLDNLAHFPKPIQNGIDSQHSVLSAFLFLIHQLSDGFEILVNESQKDQRKMIAFTFALAHTIMRHHNPSLDDISAEKTLDKLNSQLYKELEIYLHCYKKTFHPQLIAGIYSLRKSNVHFEKLDFEWFALIRLNFSLLTAADYYATSHYCNKWESFYVAFGVLTAIQRNKHFSALMHTHSHNESLYKRFEEIASKSPDTFRQKSPENLNKLRSRMAAEVIQKVREQSSGRLFYLEAPTGGGKTNMAFIASMELLQANPELNKVFYVFPFTTLATQTLQASQQTLGLEPEEWIELHGRAAWKQKAAKEETKDGLYGEERMDDIHNQFVNYPYTFLSHVRFFDILKADEKSSIYLMHRLANSIVVIDEVQAYNPELWDKMAYLLKAYAEAFNIRFIVMSATLPKIGSLAEADFCYLLPDAIDRFFTNPNFADRVSFSDELLARKQPKKEDRQDYLNWLANEIHEKSEAYRSKNGQVRTIVEFIFKKSATEFATLAEEVFHGYTVHVLSGTILEPKRKNIIRRLKSASDTEKNVLLITTQVVEAGVDIDMDLGFKNRSIIDSEEQLAGRVNRNVKKEGCTVYLFDLDDASVIYGKDRRFRETRQSLEKDYFNILRTKQFDRLYEKVKEWMDHTNLETGLAGTGRDYREQLIGKLNFPKVDSEFTLISQSNVSVFVPLEIRIKDGEEEVFTEQQLDFLETFGVFPQSDCLSGEDIFNLYRRLIQDRTDVFTDRKRNLKMLQSIMAMFTFSLFSESKLVSELKKGGNREEYGYIYLVSHREVYDYNKGLLDQKFSELIFI